MNITVAIISASVAAVVSFAIIDWLRLEFDISDKIHEDMKKRRSEKDE